MIKSPVYDEELFGAASACAACGRRVAGCDGDVKIYVEHAQAVLCSACFDRHPNRELWTCYKPGRLRRRRMIRIP